MKKSDTTTNVGPSYMTEDIAYVLVPMGMLKTLVSDTGSSLLTEPLREIKGIVAESHESFCVPLKQGADTPTRSTR